MTRMTTLSSYRRPSAKSNVHTSESEQWRGGLNSMPGHSQMKMVQLCNRCAQKFIASIAVSKVRVSDALTNRQATGSQHTSEKPHWSGRLQKTVLCRLQAGS